MNSLMLPHGPLYSRESKVLTSTLVKFFTHSLLGQSPTAASSLVHRESPGVRGPGHYSVTPMTIVMGQSPDT